MISIGSGCNHEKQNPPGQNNQCNWNTDPEPMQYKPATGDEKNAGEKNRPGLTPPWLFRPEIRFRSNRHRSGSLAPCHGAEFRSFIAVTAMRAVIFSLKFRLFGSDPGKLASHQVTPPKAI